MLVKVYGAAVQGIDATIVTIEVNSSRGIKFFLVGLPDSAVKESHERIISALQVNGYKFPTCQIVVNMAPADIRKEGSAYDLPLAIGILAATQIVSEEKLSRYLIIGELSLDGSLQPVKGALSIAISAREQGFEGFILPKQNAREAAVVNNLKVYGVENIKEVIEFFNNERNLEGGHLLHCRGSVHAPYGKGTTGGNGGDPSKPVAVQDFCIKQNTVQPLFRDCTVSCIKTSLSAHV